MGEGQKKPGEAGASVELAAGTERRGFVGSPSKYESMNFYPLDGARFRSCRPLRTTSPTDAMTKAQGRTYWLGSLMVADPNCQQRPAGEDLVVGPDLRPPVFDDLARVLDLSREPVP